jgi:hypothetical protein
MYIIIQKELAHVAFYVYTKFYNISFFQFISSHNTPPHKITGTRYKQRTLIKIFAFQSRVKNYVFKFAIFFYFSQIYNLLHKLSNKQICCKETLVRSDHPMTILLYIYCALCCACLYSSSSLSGPLSQRAIAVLVCV